MKEPKKKFKKDGSLTIAAKKYISVNLNNIDKNNLSKEEKKYANRVESGRRLAESNKLRIKDNSGRFIPKQQEENIQRALKLIGDKDFKDLDANTQKKVLEWSARPIAEFNAIFKKVKETSSDTEFTPLDLISSPDLFKIIDDFAVSSTITSWVNVDRLNTEIDKFETITIRDQNGVKKQVTPEQAKLLIRSANKKVMQAFEGGKFTAETRVTQSAKSLEIFVPDLDGLDSTEIADELEGMKDDFFTYGS